MEFGKIASHSTRKGGETNVKSIILIFTPQKNHRSLVGCWCVCVCFSNTTATISIGYEAEGGGKGGVSRKWYPSNAFNTGVYFGEGLHRRMLLPVVSHSLALVSLAALFASSIKVAETAAIPFGFSAGSLLHFQEQFKLKNHFMGSSLIVG